MHEDLFAEFVAAWEADDGDRAYAAYRVLLDTPTDDLRGITFQLAAGQVWEGKFGGSLRDEAPQAVYATGCAVLGFDPLEVVVV